MAARGLDIPSVDWIIQFDPPDDPKVRYASCHANQNRNIFIESAVQLELEEKEKPSYSYCLLNWVSCAT